MACSQSDTEESKDNSISKVLNTFVTRPAFINLHYSSHQAERPSAGIALSLSASENTDIEIVGSSKDGLKVGRVFDVGDIDALQFSNTLLFDSTDESSFEYRKDDPCFFYIPQPKLLSNLTPVDGKYLNANYLRTRHSDIFNSQSKDKFRLIPFTLLPTTTSSGLLKCAITTAIPYADPVIDSDKPASVLTVDHRLLMTWNTEHVLLTYLLLSKNREKLNFVKEMLFGCDIATDTDAISQLRKRMIMWKQDFQRCMFIVYDMLFFRSGEFIHTISKATDPQVLLTLTEASRTDPHGEYSIDLVPAIKCSGWPRPAHTFQTRERKWPPEQLVESIVSKGYQVVAKAPDTDPHPDKDFLLSFSPAEQQIALALPEQAKMSYCLLKLCFKSAKEQILAESVKTFHLKTALFWVAEQTEPHAWVANGLLWGIRSIALFLMESLRKRNLPSYFVQTNNLIRHFSVVETEKALKVFQLIHDNPSNFIQLVIDKELDFSRATMPEDSFKKIQEPGYFDQFSWLQQMKFYCHAFGLADNYPLDAMIDNMTKLKSESFYEQFVTAPFGIPHGGNIPLLCRITDDQLMYVDIFVQTVTQMEIDLFNVLDHEVEEEIVQSTEDWLSKETLDLYSNYDSKTDEMFGEHFLATMRLRLKFYANIFHVICNRLKEYRVQQPKTIKNQDALYIINFLNELVQRRSFSEENIDDLLHFMLYFCHFTRLRHHNLNFDEQILRSMREFLQDAKHMMTVYFNPREVFPLPVDINDKIETVLGECFPRKEPVNQCSVT